jgi:hypothetical protein
MSARILMTGSRNFTDAGKATDALNAALALLGTPAREGVLIHGGAGGADLLLAAAAQKMGMTLEAHPAQWETHTDKCPPKHQGLKKCAIAGHRRNAEMIAAGADLVLAFPTHGYALAPGEDRNLTSRGTWDCAEKAKNAGLPTLIVWGKDLYPFGHPAMDLLRLEAMKKRMTTGDAGQLPIVEVWLPF